MKLGAYYGSRLVGEIEQTESGRMQFRYDPEWLKDSESFALSFSLPKSEKIFQKEADFFFSNLLPEGPVRQAICERHGISIDNDFALLKQIGGECAGALVISSSPPKKGESRYEELEFHKLVGLLSSGGVYASLSEKEDMRLSLAGAQDKLPIYLTPEKKILLPLGTSPSTHVLKFENPRFKGLALNEYYMTQLAKQLGLMTVEVELMPIENGYLLIVKRYDRIVVDITHKKIERLHQEDLCQALAMSHLKKYEKEGGPSFAQVYNLVTNASHAPLADNQRLLQWQIVNVLIGNCDGHAKNTSLYRTLDSEWHLAPFYDLVSTIFYSKLSKELAMGIGGVSDIGILSPIHWKRLAETIGVNTKTIEDLMQEKLECFPKALDATHQKVLKDYGKNKVFTLLHEVLKKHHALIRKRWKLKN